MAICPWFVDDLISLCRASILFESLSKRFFQSVESIFDSVQSNVDAVKLIFHAGKAALQIFMLRVNFSSHEKISLTLRKFDGKFRVHAGKFAEFL